MSFCTIEEAWGANFGNPVPPTLKPPMNVTRQNASYNSSVRENFEGGPIIWDPAKNNVFAQNEDEDLLNRDLMGTTYNEFNVPLKTAKNTVPQGFMSDRHSALDDYYRLMDDSEDGEIQYKVEKPPKKLGLSKKDASLCAKLLEHVQECKLCRAQLIAELQLEELAKTEEDENASDVNVMDIILFIAAGIFLIFIFDGFIRLGKLLGGGRA